jgi:hypothetical protein
MYDIRYEALDDLLDCVALYRGTFRMSTFACVAIHDYHMTLVRIHIMHVHRT